MLNFIYDDSDLKLHVVVLLAGSRFLPKLELIDESLLLRLLLPLDALQHGGVFYRAVVKPRVVGIRGPAVVEVGVCPDDADISATSDVRMRTQMFGKWTVRVLKESPRRAEVVLAFLYTFSNLLTCDMILALMLPALRSPG